MTIQTRTAIRNGSGFELAEALLIYSDGRAALATRHQIRVTESALSLKPGELIGSRALTALARDLISGATTSCEYLPENILANGLDRTVWWIPAGRREMYFARPAIDKIDKANNGRKAAQPPLVLVASGRHLRVFALRDSKRPTPDTPLMNAPYLNLYDDGTVCLGSSRVPDRHGPDQIEAWTQGWQDSAFSHANPIGTQKRLNHRLGVLGLWQRLIEQQTEHFPTDALVHSGYTLNAVIASGSPKR
jgi:PRTRC genetic system protein B